MKCAVDIRWQGAATALTQKKVVESASALAHVGGIEVSVTYLDGVHQTMFVPWDKLTHCIIERREDEG